MNRRSILRLLGLAPIAAPAALAISVKPDLPPIDYAGLADDLRSRISSILETEAHAGAGADRGFAKQTDSYLELMPDGTSRFVANTNAFYITPGAASA